MMIGGKLGIAAAMLALIGGTAYANPVTFFGEDLNGNPDAVLASHPNSDAANSAFFTNLVGVGTETFEGIAAGSIPPIPITFAGAGTATITDSGQGGVNVQNNLQSFPFDNGTNGVGRFAISGDQYLEVDSGGFAINFNNPGGIAAFGFYATDLGDFGGDLTLTLTALNGTTSVLDVHNMTSPNGTGSPEDGSVVYFGFYDTATAYTSIAFNNSQAGIDSFGFDNFSVGSLQQIQPSVPEPSSLAGLFGLGLAAFAAARRRRSA